MPIVTAEYCGSMVGSVPDKTVLEVVDQVRRQSPVVIDDGSVVEERRNLRGGIRQRKNLAGVHCSGSVGTLTYQIDDRHPLVRGELIVALGTRLEIVEARAQTAQKVILIEVLAYKISRQKLLCIQ
jgi:hypothetical protein